MLGCSNIDDLKKLKVRYLRVLMLLIYRFKELINLTRKLEVVLVETILIVGFM
jgi:hypothetical protein